MVLDDNFFLFVLTADNLGPIRTPWPHRKKERKKH